MIAQIIINSNVKSLNRIFDYNVPINLIGTICVGDRVLIRFGNKKELEEGFVIGFKETSEYKLKDIVGIQKGIKLTEFNIELAKLMSRRYFCNISDCIKLMLPPGTTTKVIENRTKSKTQNFVYLKKDIIEIEEEIENNIIKSEKHKRVLYFLMQNNGVQTTDLEVYTDVSSSILKTLEKKEYIEIVEQNVERDPFENKNIIPSFKLKLNNEQQYAFNVINKNIQENTHIEALLHGVTGSGKTEVYMQLIEEVIKKEKSAIMLVPEISLTPQMVDRFIARFGKDIVAVLHSKLSIGERFDQWNKIKNGECKIIIGARSALFAPVQNLGIIIIDEEHDQSYKSETNPRYNAKDIAGYIAKKQNIPLILGTATPDITTYYKAQEKKIELLELSKRANMSSLPEVNVVDLRNELANGNRSILSKELYSSIEENIKNKKQTILFLNRRGYSTFVMCRECGYVVKCKNCNITMTYHSNKDRLKCHYCGHEERNLSTCPECKSNNIKYFGTGTQKLEDDIKKMFPQASTIRMDIDTVSCKNGYEDILNKFKNDNIDILIGTQMIVKGHHFPNVTLVGVIAADSSLYIEDYKANEKTFQILTQVAGRAGRENNSGKVIIQTYNPENFAIECSKKQDYNELYNIEIELRKQLKYPPFCDIIVIELIDMDNNKLVNNSNKLYNVIYEIFKKENIDANIFKPLPCPIDKIKNKYRWRIIIKGKLNTGLIDIINFGINNVNSKTTRIIVDTNPNNMG